MSYRSLVEGLLEVPEVRLHGWLAVVDEVHTITIEELSRLSYLTPPGLPKVRLLSNGLEFDEKMANWFFAATRGWVPSSHVSVDELRGIMPSGVVSGKAERVGVWGPVVRAFERTVAKVAASGSLLFTLVDGGERKYLTTMDLENRLFACSCPAYNTEDENDRKRHALCKHILLSIFHHHDAILTLYAGDADAWRRSLMEAQNHAHRRTILCNWLYYFVKKVFSTVGFGAGRYENLHEVEEALNLMEGDGQNGLH